MNCRWLVLPLAPRGVQELTLLLGLRLRILVMEILRHSPSKQTSIQIHLPQVSLILLQILLRRLPPSHQVHLVRNDTRFGFLPKSRMVSAFNSLVREAHFVF